MRFRLCFILIYQICLFALFLRHMQHKTQRFDFEDPYNVGLILSKHAHAEIISINTDTALAIDGVHSFVSAKDLSTDQNKFGTSIVQDECVFADTHVYCMGMIIGIVLANDQETAQRAARAVHIDYKARIYIYICDYFGLLFLVIQFKGYFTECRYRNKIIYSGNSM